MSSAERAGFHRQVTCHGCPAGMIGLACISFALREMPESVRETVLSGMARVTKPGGSVVVVDYALPCGSLVRTLAYQ